MPKAVFDKAFEKDSNGKVKSKGRGIMRHLYEVFISAKEDWQQSSIMMNSRQSSSNKRFGCYRWRKFSEIKEEYGEAVASEMKDPKLKTQT